MNRNPGVAEPSIATPGEGMRFKEWMEATNVFDAIERTQKRDGDKTAITFLGTDWEAPPRNLSYAELVDGTARTANALRSLGFGRCPALKQLHVGARI